MNRRRGIERRKKLERRRYLKEQAQKQKQKDLEYKKAQLQKPKPVDFGHKKEILVTQLINALACYSRYPWLTSAAQSNRTEDGEGKDVIVYTTHGEFYLQIKSTIDAAEDFTRKEHSEQYKTMYMVARPDKEQVRCCVMPLPNQNAYSFIVIVVVYRSENTNKETEIEDIDLVLKKVQIALGIIKQYVDELKRAGKK